MTVQTNTNVASFTGNGVTVDFPFGFKFNSAADLIVALSDFPAGVATELTLNSDYTASGAGNEEGGAIHLLIAAPTDQQKVKIVRKVDILQLTDLRNQGKFYAEVHEDVFDLLIMIDQQQQTEIDEANAKSDEAVATANAANAKSDQAVEKAAQNLVDMQAQYDAFEQGASFVVIGDYAAGLVVDGYNKVFRKDGEFYRAKAALTLPYPLNGDWATDAPNFVSVGDAVLRQELGAENGSAIVGGIVAKCASVSSLLDAKRDGSQAVFVAAYHDGWAAELVSPKGGGRFVWSPDFPKTSHDGGYVIDPDKTYPSNWSDQAQLVAWFSPAASGAGCFVRESAPLLSVYEFGAKGDNATDDYRAFNAAVQAAINHKSAGVNVEAGTFLIGQDLILPARDAVPENAGFVFRGAGSGRKSCWLRFSSGSLRVQCSSFKLVGFTVTSLTGIGCRIEGFTYTGGASGFSVRGYLEDVRAELCETDGFFIEDSWIVTFDKCYARFNKRWGLNMNRGPLYNRSCNSLSWLGGEIQGNGTEGTTGGGVKLGAAVNVKFGGAASIEGNYADGVLLDGAVYLAEFDGIYFEKNGTLTTNVDLRSPTATAANRPSTVIMRNCNHTPINGGQERAIDVADIVDFQVHNPTFFGATGESYSQPPIRVSESVASYSSGFVSGGRLVWAGYTQMLTNDCTQYGKPTTVVFGAQAQLPDSASTTISHFLPLDTSDGQFIEGTAAFNGANFAAGDIRTRLGFGGWPGVAEVSNNLKTSTFPGDKSGVTHSHSANVLKSSAIGGVSVHVTRLGADAADTYAGTANLLGLSVTFRKGWVR